MSSAYGPTHSSTHSVAEHRFQPYHPPPPNVVPQSVINVKHENSEAGVHMHPQGMPPPPTLMVPVQHPHYAGVTLPPSIPSYSYMGSSNMTSGDGSSHSSMSPSQKHRSGGADGNINPLDINIPEFKERFEKWMVDLSNSGRDMSCFFFDEEKGGIFCRICIEASKSGGFCTKPAQEQARRCLTKHLNREKHKSALQQLCKDGKISGSMVIAAGVHNDDFDDRSDSNDDPSEHSRPTNNPVPINPDPNTIKNELYPPPTSTPFTKSPKKMKKKRRRTDPYFMHPPMPPYPLMGFPSYISSHTLPFDRALHAHFCVVHLMAKDCYERLYVNTLGRLKQWYLDNIKSTSNQQKENDTNLTSEQEQSREREQGESSEQRQEQDQEQDQEREQKQSQEQEQEQEQEQKKKQEKEQMQQWMSEYTIDDIVLNENKYRGLLTIVEFMGGPNSILYEPNCQSLEFANTLLKALNDAANAFKLQVMNENKMETTSSTATTTKINETSDLIMSNKEQDQNKNNNPQSLNHLGELFWLDNTLRMNSAGRASMQLYISAIGIFHTKYASTHFPHWPPPPPPPPGPYPMPMGGYSGMSPPPPPPMHNIDHGLLPPPPPYGPGYGGPPLASHSPHPHSHPPPPHSHPHSHLYPPPPPPGPMNMGPPGLEPTVKQERVMEDYRDVEMK